MKSVILIDDEAGAMDALEQQLMLYHNNIKVNAHCNTISSALEAISRYRPDLVFLDIELEGESGFDIFKHFPHPPFKVIFTTAHENYAVKAFRFAAIDYLLKPIQSDLLSEALKKVSDTIDREHFSLKIDSFLHNIHQHKTAKKIVLKTVEKIHLVNLDDILFCEADRGYTNFHLSDSSRIVMSSTMGGYEELFEDSNFFRIHQSYLLNLNYFKQYEKTDGGQAVLKNGVKLPVATRKKDALLQKLADL